jgi:hypothetical protein
MMKKTILSSMFALSLVTVVFAVEGDTEAVAAKEAEATAKTTTTAVAEPKDAPITPQALGMDMSRHYAKNIPQGGTPKSPKPVGVVKN